MTSINLASRTNTMLLSATKTEDVVWQDHTPILGDIAAWRARFPWATVANIAGRFDVYDDDLAHLAGMHKVFLYGCSNITDAGLAHLRGVHTLMMGGCWRATDAGLAHLAGVHTISMRGCNSITDAGIAHLKGVHTLTIDDCPGITDEGLAHLAGIHSLSIVRGNITDAGLAHIRGVRDLTIRGCTRITDAGVALLDEVHSLVMTSCPNVSDAALPSLKSLRYLDARNTSITPASLLTLKGKGVEMPEDTPIPPPVPLFP